MAEGWLKIYRKLADWEWYTNSKMVHLFLHLIIKATPTEKTWRGIRLERGQLIIGRQKLSADTGISERSVRTCLSRLEESGEIEIKTTNKYSIITVCKYGDYQPVEGQADQQNDQPNDQQSGQQNDHNIRSKEDKNILSISPNVDMVSTGSPGEGAKRTKPKQKKEKSLVTKGREVFEAYYKELFEESYYWKAKDSVAMKELFKQIEYSRKNKKVPMPVDDDSLVSALDAFIRSITKGFVLENFSVTTISSQYNNIISEIIKNRNGRKSATNQQASAGASVVERQRAACVDDIAKADELYFKQMREQGRGGTEEEQHAVPDNK